MKAKTEVIDLSSTLRQILQGVLDGTIQINVFSAPKKRGRPPVVKEHVPAKRGRKPLSASEKKRNAIKTKKAKIREAKRGLPESKSVLEFMADKLDGMKLTAISKEFGVKRTVLKPLVDRMLKRKELTEFKGLLFIGKRPRGLAKEKVRSKKVTLNQLEGVVKNNPGITLSGIAQQFGEESYQKFIRSMKALEKKKVVVKKGKEYHPA